MITILIVAAVIESSQVIWCLLFNTLLYYSVAPVHRFEEGWYSLIFTVFIHKKPFLTIELRKQLYTNDS